MSLDYDCELLENLHKKHLKTGIIDSVYSQAENEIIWLRKENEELKSALRVIRLWAKDASIIGVCNKVLI